METTETIETVTPEQQRSPQTSTPVQPDTVTAPGPYSGLTEGRVLHYVLPNGEHRKADVVRAFRNATAPDLVNLYVHLDGANDGGLLPLPGGQAITPGINGIWWVTSVHHDPTGTVPGTWHWIEGAPATAYPSSPTEQQPPS